MLAAAPQRRLHASTPDRAEPTPAPTPAAVPPDPGAEELAIVSQARHQPGAFAPLYERYADPIFGYCYRRTGDREAAADLTHQIFARVLTALPTFDDRAQGGSFRSWLFTIARNLVIDNHRTRRETASLEDSAGHHALRDPARSPEEHAIAGERRDALLAAMTRLTDGQRQVVELRLAGLTGPEIAVTLHMELSAVKSAQFRAYARLRELLGETLALDHPAPRAGDIDHG